MKLPWFKKLGPVAQIAGDVAREMTLDKDQVNQITQAIYIAELNTKTVPWIDAVHKMGRQILAFAQIGAYVWLAKTGVEISPELVAGISGPAGIYTLLKGSGK